MKKILVVILISLSLQGFSQDIPITYTALLNAALEPDNLEFQGYLISNNYILIKSTPSNISKNETWAYGYDYNKETANIWIFIQKFNEETDHLKTNLSTFSSVSSVYSIQILSFGHYAHNYLSNKIEKYCVYEGTKDLHTFFEDNPVYKKVYKHKSGVIFHIWNSLRGYNIEVFSIPIKFD